LKTLPSRPIVKLTVKKTGYFFTQARRIFE
jgi:hypothetical protein